MYGGKIAGNNGAYDIGGSGVIVRDSSDRNGKAAHLICMVVRSVETLARQEQVLVECLWRNILYARR